jgi:tetratricopeptide (TPR) repeat protein
VTGRLRVALPESPGGRYSPAMPGWLVRVALAILLVPLPMPVQGQPSDPQALALAEALATYRGGELRGALQRLGTIPQEKLNDTVFRFCLRDDLPPRLRIVRLRISIALLTEMAIERTRHQVGAWSDPYFAAARALVRRLSQMVDDGRDGAGEAEGRFARDWYLLVVSFRHGRSEAGWSRAYLAEARELFPKDPQVLLVSGSDHEMVSHVSAGYLRRFSANGQGASESRINPEKELEEAEKYLKQAAALAPDLVEARLRLGRVLMRRGDLDGAARELRSALEHTAQDPAGYDQVRYLAWMFLGLVDVDRGNLESAERSYVEALRLFPNAQAIKVAMSELAYLKGRDADAAAQVVSMLESFARQDPWWTYLLGDAWHFEARLVDLRAQALR